MNTKIAFLLLLLIVATPFVSAKSLMNHTTNINMAKDGSAIVKETFTFLLETAEEEDQFVDRISQYGALLSLWRLYDENIYLHTGQSSNTTNQSVSARKDGRNGVIEINYAVEGLAIQTPGLQNTWELTTSNINYPTTGGLLVVNDKQLVNISLPDNAEIVQAAPTPEQRGTNITWRGPLIANRLFLQYELKKVAVPSSLVNVPLPLANTTSSLAFAALVILLLIGGVLNRAKLEHKVQSYVTSHSSIKSDDYEERLERDVE